MINLQPFVGGDDDSERFASVVSRLGPCPEGVVLGPRQRDLTDRALAPSVAIHAEATESLLSYGDPVYGSPWGHIAKALTWSSRYRLSAKMLLKESWLSDGSDKPDGLSSIAGPVRPNIDVLSTPLASGKVKCNCSGHSWATGHRYQGGWHSCDFIQKSRYCKVFKCQLWGCHRPRHHEVWCHGHSKVFTALPFPMKAAAVARVVLDDLIP